MRKALVVLILSSLAVACTDGGGLDRPGRGRYCGAKTDPIPNKIDRAAKVSLQRVNTDPNSAPAPGAEEGLPVGTFVYEGAEIFWKRTHDANNDGQKNELTMVHVTHALQAQRKWDFENNCVRIANRNELFDMGGGFNAATRFETKPDGSIRVLALKNLNFRFDGAKIQHTINDVDPAQFDTLVKVYLLDNRQAQLYRRTGKLGRGQSLYELRTVLEEGENRYYFAVRYGFYPPNATVPQEKLLP